MSDKPKCCITPRLSWYVCVYAGDDKWGGPDAGNIEIAGLIDDTDCLKGLHYSI